MTHVAQPIRGYSSYFTQHTHLVSDDFIQDDIVRPELCNDAILASHPNAKQRWQPRALLDRLPMEPERP